MEVEVSSEENIPLDVGGDVFTRGLKKKSLLSVGIAQGDCKSYDDDELFQVSGFKFHVLNHTSHVSSLKLATNSRYHTVDFGGIVAGGAVCIVEPVGVFVHAQDVREVAEQDFSSETYSR